MLLLAACKTLSTAAPNPVAAGPCPPTYRAFAAAHPGMAAEIGRLPVLQDGVSVQEAAALDELAHLAARHPEPFAAAENPRWSDFATVVYRLNAPALVDIYLRDQVDWVDWRSLPTWPVSSRYVFRHKKGDCTAISDFAVKCLRIGGYRAWEHRIPPLRPVDSHYSVCLLEADGKRFVMDNGRPLKIGIVPYDAAAHGPH
jgi:hypothetical protein